MVILKHNITQGGGNCFATAFFFVFQKYTHLVHICFTVRSTESIEFSGYNGYNELQRFFKAL